MGEAVGRTVGIGEGLNVGRKVGVENVGRALGCGVGETVGAKVIKFEVHAGGTLITFTVSGIFE